MHGSAILSSTGSAPGHGFSVRNDLPDQAVDALVLLATVDRYISQHRNEGLDNDVTMSRLVDTRNAAHHAILSLADWKEQPQTGISSELVYECCRLTATIYSNAVVHGLPLQLGWHQKQVHQLRLLFKGPVSDSQNASDVFVWALCIANLAASGSPDQDFFESRLGSAIAKRGLSSWSMVEKIVEEFLWSRTACADSPVMFRKCV